MNWMNLSLSPQSLRVILIGTRAHKTSVRLIHLMAVWKRRMSFWCLATSLVGNRFVQNCKPCQPSMSACL